MSNQLLPYRPHPKKNELLTSWLARLAAGLGLKLHSFSQLVLHGFQVWNRDADRSAPDKMLHLLVERTGITYDRIFQTTLRAYEGYAFEQFNPTGKTSLVCPVGIWHRKRNAFGLAFCSNCLSDDGDEPYFRRHWRLTPIVTCTKHKRILLDRCPNCGAPISFHRNDFEDRNSPTLDSFDTCYQCKTALSQVYSDSESDIGLLDCQGKIEAALQQGWIFMQDRPIYSFLYLRIVKQFMKLFLSKSSKCQRLQKICSTEMGIGTPITYFKPEVDHLSINDRRVALKMTSWLLDDWPNRFTFIAKKADLRRSPLVRDLKNAPYWFDQILWEYFDGRTYDSSLDEIVSASKYLERMGIEITQSHLCSVLGFHESKNVTKYTKRYHSPSVNKFQS